MLKIMRASLQGLCIGSTIFLFSGLFLTDSATQKMILSFLLMSLAMGAFSAIYDHKKLPLLLKTLIHVTGSWIVFLVTAFVNQWFPFKISITLSATLLFLLIFFAIWTLFYLKEKNEIKMINQRLK